MSRVHGIKELPGTELSQDPFYDTLDFVIVPPNMVYFLSYLSDIMQAIFAYCNLGIDQKRKLQTHT